jgi:hypothetical protein
MTDRIELKLEHRPDAWSTNEDRSISPYKRAEMVALWKQASFLAIRKYRMHHPEDFDRQKLIVRGRVSPRGDKIAVFADVLPGKWIITAVIVFDTNRKRDPHNSCGTVLKACIDGLVEARAFPDDTPPYIGHREPILLKDPTAIFRRSMIVSVRGTTMPRLILERAEVQNADTPVTS